MRVNSQSRIAQRRKSALARRKNEAKVWKAATHENPNAKNFKIKLKIAETDIANLEKKGVHHA